MCLVAHIQEDLSAVANSVVIILTEFSRIFFLSNASLLVQIWLKTLLFLRFTVRKWCRECNFKTRRWTHNTWIIPRQTDNVNMRCWNKRCFKWLYFWFARVMKNTLTIQHVLIPKLKRRSRISICGFFIVDQSLVTRETLKMPEAFYGQRHPTFRHCHLLPGHHLDLLGHLGPIHAESK